MQDVLIAEPRTRLPWRLVAAGVALLVLAGAASTLRDERPAGRLEVSLEGLDGSALRGEQFVRLNLGVLAEGAAELGEVRLSLSGASVLGQSVDGLDGDGRATVQVDLVPPCPAALEGYVDGTLDVTVVDRAGRSRLVQLDLPDDGPLERLVRYRCTT